MAADPDRALYSQYEEQLIPRTYLISRDGRIAFCHVGLVIEEFDELQAVLAEQLGARD